MQEESAANRRQILEALESANAKAKGAPENIPLDELLLPDKETQGNSKWKKHLVLEPGLGIGIGFVFLIFFTLAVDDGRTAEAPATAALALKIRMNVQLLFPLIFDETEQLLW